MAGFTPLPRRRGRIDYLRNKDRGRWGFEEWTMTHGSDGLRVLSSHCEMRFGDVVRDSIVSVDTDWQPVESTVRIMNERRLTGPWLHASTSGLRYEGAEEAVVPAGRFECRRVNFAAMSNNHPPSDMWISGDGDCLYVKGMVQGYMDSVFELAELEGKPLA